MKAMNGIDERSYLDYKAPLYIRVAGWIICRFLVNSGYKGFQGVAEKNWDLGENKVDVIMSTVEVIQWIHFVIGDRKNIDQVKEKYGLYQY